MILQFRVIIISFLFFGSKLLFAQYNASLVHFQKDSLQGNLLEYVIIGDTTQKKPLLLYCTGSLPIPLFIKAKDRTFSTLPFNLKEISEAYHVLVVSKPGIPMTADSAFLNSSYCFIDPRTKEYPEVFTSRNTLNDLSQDYQVILDKTLEKAWVDSSKILAMGHSQGARIAFELAKHSPVVTHLAYLSADPNGRLYGILDSEQKSSNNILDRLDFWKQVQLYQNDDKALEHSDSYKTWKSFSSSTVLDFLNIDIPIFLAFGTADKQSQNMTIVPYLFIEHQKKNLTFVPYEGLNHSFFETNPNGSTNFDAYHLPDVYQDVLDWWLLGKEIFDFDLKQEGIQETGKL